MMKRTKTLTMRLKRRSASRARLILAVAVAALLLCWNFPAPVHAADGDLDSGFAGGGKLTLLRDSRSIVDYSVVDNRVVNRGIAVEQIERDTGQKIRQHRLVDANAARPDEVRGDDVVVFRPKVEKKDKERAPVATEPPVTTPAREQRKLDQQQAKEQAELEKQQRKEQQQLEAQQRINEKQKRKEQQRLEEQQRVEQKQERKKVKPPETAPTKPPESVALQDMDNQHKAEKRALKEQRQREEQVMRNRVESQRTIQAPPAKPAKPAKQKPAKPNKP